jgi:hypothetical protein
VRGNELEWHANVINQLTKNIVGYPLASPSCLAPTCSKSLRGPTWDSRSGNGLDGGALKLASPEVLSTPVSPLNLRTTPSQKEYRPGSVFVRQTRLSYLLVYGTSNGEIYKPDPKYKY